jgi:hypothetical protein
MAVGRHRDIGERKRHFCTLILVPVAALAFPVIVDRCDGWMVGRPTTLSNRSDLRHRPCQLPACAFK